MKRLLTLFLVLWCSTAWAVEPIDLARGFNPYVAGAGVAAACSDTNKDTQESGAETRTVGSSNTDTWANKWVSGSTYTLTKIQISAYKATSDATDDTITAKIYSDNSGTPGTLLATSASVRKDSYSTSEGWITFTFAGGQAIANATTYWLAFTPSGTTNATTNLYNVSNPGYGTNTLFNNDGTWHNVADYTRWKMRTIACE